MQPILIAFDGSPESERAVSVAADLVGGGPAVVLHVAALPVPAVPVGGGGLVAPASALMETEAEERRRAERIAERGVELARIAGLDAEPMTADARPGAGDVILETAAALDARLIVVAPHGHSRLARLLLGCTSDTVMHSAPVPVLAV